MDIKESIILVTSAGSVIGRTCSSHFAHLGATLILCDQNADSLKESYEQISAFTNKVFAMHVCSDDTTSINLLFDQIESELGATPDVVVNCWTSSPMPSLMAPEPMSIYIDHLSSAARFLYTYGQVSAERFRSRNKKGVIVNVISHDNHEDLTGVESLAALVSGFTHSWAKELTPFNIRVGGVIPSVSHTKEDLDAIHWAEIQDELVRNTEYIVANEYFSGRVVSTEV
ncbi:SDR family oxidoreductase [Vibrio natriegens]|jgi:NAD(P)-dependent dehydrogenase (short-subunit alcohol dehydrogenase family)|uniref:Short-chain dehydrogenase n=1 Tax=Vibrio natriegens NBRC 15636 = ATCC 14048 = DSM 759 TaxID=1219067 RepID=A0AAN1CWH7_VIBNA|nr:SDR family oxidoreductase [Vibrio natriegens]ALR15033.1 short-chain dehydrogenase [Vibrio natriegens NBRC 15636 = ATCC 14048 = DSM 759]ANQ13103.1 short-chain dehydrogenase [Vibrio natriegens NBRC 15636 = ATCC 14048 = DSM 759]EPM39549.1 short-chain dehydrogenase [Vibrio natriegens NBRC 15636 = ATCC 14048 = DSM 759]MDX6027528.1 SDR family oxidoreductase [Vibrio natriegens NBRC 15636 = ATCC 14048 = DSM 759]UUI10844.1 SDR family oxidoreductase [Vibrio natriegens]